MSPQEAWQVEEWIQGEPKPLYIFKYKKQVLLFSYILWTIMNIHLRSFTERMLNRTAYLDLSKKSCNGIHPFIWEHADKKVTQSTNISKQQKII